MKAKKLGLIALLLMAGSTLQAGKGAAIGIGSGFGGFILGRATAPRSETVVIHENSRNSSDMRKLERENRHLQRTINRLEDKIDDLKNEIDDLKDTNRSLKRQLRQNGGSPKKKRKTSSWFGKLEKDVEDEF